MIKFNLRRRVRQVILFLYACALLGALALVVGPYINDRIIERDPGRALATVTAVELMRTTVEYQDEEGIYHSPSTGLLYPTGLGQGQRVWVNYAKSDPEMVKVEGRAWTLAIIPALSTAVVSTIIAALLWWVLSFLGRPRRSESSSPEVPKE